MKKNVARLNARNRREPSRIQHAIERAASHNSDPGVAQPVIRLIKGKGNTVQNWARDSILTLNNEGVAMSNTWKILKTTAKALGVTIIGKWSPRTSGRVVLEGGLAAGFMIMEYVLSCIGSQ